MGRTTITAIGVSAALLLAAPTWAASLVDITGAIATQGTVAGNATGGMGGMKATIQRHLPTFTPPHIDGPARNATGAPPSTARVSHPSAPSASGARGGSGWKAGSRGAGPTTAKSSWATSAKGGRSSGAAARCWTTASSGGRAPSAGNGWKAGGATGRP